MTDNNSKKDLTNGGEVYTFDSGLCNRVWCQCTQQAENMGHGDIYIHLRVHQGDIVRANVIPALTIIEIR